MSLNSKSRRRVRIVIVALLLIGVCGTVALVLRKQQVARKVLQDRDLGFAALESGDYYTAMHKIGPYVQRHPTDVDALSKYALARRNVEEPNAKHLVDAISIYRRILELSPEDDQARDQLLEIYVDIGFNTEILAATEGRRDPPSIRARAIALANLKQDEKARTALSEYLSLKPSDLQMQMFWIELLRRSGESATSVMTYANDAVARNPDDPNSLLLMAYALLTTERPKEAAPFATRACTQPIADPQAIRIAARILDDLNLHDNATAVLARAAQTGKDPRFEASVVSRLYQSGQYERVYERIAKLGIPEQNIKTELLAYKALSLRAQERDDEAAKVVSLLEGRTTDFPARAWAAVLKSLPQQGAFPDDRAIIEACRDGLRGEGDNAFFRLNLGDAYNRLGESELASTDWIRAATLAPTWDEPLIRLIPVMIIQGRRTEAIALASRLKALAPNNPKALAMVALVQARATNRQDAASVAELTALLDRVQALSPGEPQTLQTKLSLLALTGQADEAKKLVRDCLAPDHTQPLDTYLALAGASEMHQLGLETECFNRCEQARGASIELAVARSRWGVRRGQTPEAVESFDKAMQQAPDRDQIPWRIAWAQLLELAHDSRAVKYWTELAGSHPQDVAVQRAVLNARSLQDSRQLTRQAIDCLKAVIGDEGLAWRMAEARWILQGAPMAGSPQDVERELVKATTILNDLAGRYPDNVNVRESLSDCLLRLGKREAAIEHLTAAARLSPGAFTPSIRVAALLQSTGDFDQAKPYLEQAERALERATAPDSASDAPSAATMPAEDSASATRNRDAAWRMLASLYANRGEPGHAYAIYQRLGDTNGQSVDLAMAQFLASRGELNEDACAKLLASPSLSSLAIVIEQYARVGRTNDAEAVLAKLDSVDAQPGQREMVRATYYQRRSDLAKAIANFETVTTAVPANEAAWVGLVRCLIFQGDAAKAVDVASRAKAAIPDSLTFDVLLQNAALVRDTAPLNRLRPLTASLLEGPEQSELPIEALKICRDGAANGKTNAQVLQALEPLANQAPKVATIQYLLADLYHAVGNNDAAITVVGRLMQLQPADPAPAQRATELLAAAGRWDQLVPIAQQWRNRLGGATLPADQILATAFISLGRYSEALKQLEPYAARAASAPSEWARVLVLNTQALVGLGRIPEAESMLFPALPTSDYIRRAAAQTAASMIRDTSTAQAWLEKIAAAIPATEIKERIILAQAWLALSKRPDQAALQAQVQAQLAGLTAALSAAPDSSADVWIALGMLKEAGDDIPGAMEAYRQGVRLDGSQSLAKNNLAMLLLKQDKPDVSEALRLAQEAAKDDQDPRRADYLDTLGQVQMKMSDLEGAEKSLRSAVELMPSNLVMRQNLVLTLTKLGKQKEARKALDELESLATIQRQTDPQLDARLKELAAALQAASSAN